MVGENPFAGFNKKKKRYNFERLSSFGRENMGDMCIHVLNMAVASNGKKNSQGSEPQRL